MGSLAELERMVGVPFASGAAEWERWENWLLTDCTAADPELADDGMAHPVALFPLSLRAAGVTIASLFERFGVGAGGSVRLAGYGWEYHRPLRVGQRYTGSAGVQRATAIGSALEVEFALLLSDDEGPVAAMTAVWELNGLSG